MSKFTVNKELFAKLLKLCELGINKELALNVTASSIAGLVHFNKNIIISALIPGKYEEIGEIGIDSLPPFIKLLDSTSATEVTLTKHENSLNCEYENMEYGVDLRAAQYIVNKPDEKKVVGLMESLVGCPNFTITPKDAENILKYAASINAKTITFIGKDTKVVANLKGPKEYFKITLPLKDAKEPFKVPFSELFFKVLTGIQDSNVLVTINPATKLAHIKLDSKEINFECLLIGTL